MASKGREIHLLLVFIGLLSSMFIFAEPAFAELSHLEIGQKIGLLDSKITVLQKNTENFDSEKLGSRIFEFRNISNLFLELNDLKTRQVIEGDKILDAQYHHYEIHFKNLMESFKKKASEYLNGDDIPFEKRKLVRELFKVENVHGSKIKSIEEKYQRSHLITTELHKIKNNNKLHKMLHEIAIEDEVYNPAKYRQNRYLEQAMSRIYLESTWDLMPLALEKFAGQFSDPQVKNRIVKNTETILDAIEKIEGRSGEIIIVNGTITVIGAGGFLADNLIKSIEDSVDDLNSINDEIEERYELKMQELRRNSDSKQIALGDSVDGKDKSKDKDKVKDKGKDKGK